MKRLLFAETLSFIFVRRKENFAVLDKIPQSESVAIFNFFDELEFCSDFSGKLPAEFDKLFAGI